MSTPKKNKDGFIGGALLTLEEQMQLKAKNREKLQKAEQAEAAKSKASSASATDTSSE